VPPVRVIPESRDGTRDVVVFHEYSEQKKD
jgi:hypothetical protein